MDDDLLADDGQFKDDGLDDLDVDEENALLGLSDDDLENGPGNDDQELEFVDEDGNIVDMRESNVELYEVANVKHSKSKTKSYHSSKPRDDDDVLELDLDIEESFSQEDPVELSSKFSSNERHKEKLTSTHHRRQESDKLSVSRSDHTHRPDREYERVKMESSYTSRKETQKQYLKLEFDEESEDENVEDDHRERFKSERSNIITLTPAKNRDIPDTLESVISIEESARVQAFLDNEQKRKLRWKSKGQPFRGKSNMYQQPHHQQQQQQPHHQQQHQQQYQYQQQQQQQVHQQPQHHLQQQQLHQHIHQQPSQQIHQQPQQIHQQPQQIQQQSQQIQQQSQQIQQQSQQQIQQQQVHQQPSQQIHHQPQQQPQIPQQQPIVSRKILINPHFKGGPPRLPPAVATASTGQILYPSQLVNVASAPATTYEAPPANFQQPTYSPPETPHQIPPSTLNYSAPPANVQYTHPEYPPQSLPPQGPPPPVWPPSSTVGHHYLDPQSVQPPYLDQHMQNPNYQNTYSPAPGGYQNTYQSAPPTNTFQPPPPIHHQQQQVPYAPPPPMGGGHSQPPPQNQFMQVGSHQHMPSHHVSQQPRFQGQSNMSSMTHQHQAPQRNKYNQPQRFQRQPEKRPGNPNIRSVPMKQPRMEHIQRKPNFHVNNSNIREIPLVDTLPSSKKTFGARRQPVVEEEDEKTKELRMKIEEQKLLREQIMKRKEERRRQMATQRLQEINKRKRFQQQNPTGNQSAVTVVQKAVVKQQGNPPAQMANVKPNVKDRIGAPMQQQAGPSAKKKIIVVRKKSQQDGNVVQNAPQVSAPQKTQAPTVVQRQVSKINIIYKNDITQNTAPTPTAKKPSIKAPVQPPSSVKTNVTQAAAQPSIKKEAVEKKVEPAKPAVQKKKLVIVRAPPNRRLMLGGPRMKFQPRPGHSLHQRMPPPMQRFPGPRNQEPMFRGPRFCDNRMFPNHGRPPMDDLRMPHPMFQEHRPPMPINHREPLLPREPMSFPPSPRFFPPDGPPHGPPHPHSPPHFFPPDGPPHPHSPPRFRMPPGPGFQNFRPPRGEMFQDCFSPPPFRFHNQVPPPMFDHGEPMMFQQRPMRFQGNPLRHKSPVRPQNRQGNVKPQANVPAAKVKSVDVKEEEKEKPSAIIKLKKTCGDGDQKNDGQAENVPKTSTVMVENLSSSTNDDQLRKLCKVVGFVNSIELVKSERKAIIKFKEPIQAVNFQKKYQRQFFRPIFRVADCFKNFCYGGFKIKKLMNMLSINR